MRFYLDEDLSYHIATIGRERFGLDVTSAHEHDMNAATDEEQLWFATNEGRGIVTKNRDDFLRLADRFYESGAAFTSIVIASQTLLTRDFHDVARALAYYHELHPEDFIPGLVDYLHPAPLEWHG